ncbi:copper chaperone PCu(A)C [Pseudonocardia phyllosphaerae]|uniref:copper chaperone PCu(A)C n=1 Tax=Pseudonocardia phyllosphaerae TaxID=3390502 RepID=UPI0039792773
MSRNRRRPTRALAGAAGAVALTGLLVSGCGAGQLSQTSLQTAAVNGLNTSAGTVDLRDVQISYPPQPAGPDALYKAGGSAPLRANLVNVGDTADKLVRVTSPYASNVTVSGDTRLAKGVALVSAGDTPLAPTSSKPVQIRLDGLKQPIPAGAQVPMTFVFERAGSVNLVAPTGVPMESHPDAKPERAAPEGKEHGVNGAETGVNAENGGQAKPPSPDKPAAPAPSERGEQPAQGTN